jgi:hypothetical protein
MTAILDTIVHHYYACVTVGPLFSRDIGLFEKKTWPCCTAIAGYPGLQPGNDGRIDVRATSIGHLGIVGPMKLKDGNGTGRVTSSRGEIESA